MASETNLATGPRSGYLGKFESLAGSVPIESLKDGTNLMDREHFLSEAEKILAAAKEKKVELRLLGALAMFIHSPKHGHLFAAYGRSVTDIDFAASSKQKRQIVDLLTGLGAEFDKLLAATAMGQNRSIFYFEDFHSDVFFDKLEFCQTIDFSNRLTVDYPTLPLAELFMEKMQIVKLNKKDITDTIILLMEHNMDNSDEDTINIGYIADLCANDWPLYYTLTNNMKLIKDEFLGQYDISSEEKKNVTEKIVLMLNQIEEKPKSFGWKLRAKIGTKKPWYREVEELVRAREVEEKEQMRKDMNE